MKKTMKTIATSPSAKAIGMPENMTSRVIAAIEGADREGAHFASGSETMQGR